MLDLMVLCRTAELFGFIFRVGKGSHRIYVKMV
ncbi:hypothetical protein FHEFKHOI_01239 [Candidatus Methanoperedenaceae archaeon GB50]|nr:MAG: hypothetical protein KBONHNOK_00424 [Candidatus Methanoperedenaceae archaeon GB50]CAD7772420.1 hypothetical protein AIOGIFDO_01229 [Candidatus Methanoperedenaceae archaeon GB37]CAD7772521.1 hypothetical protein FHEFKHOI_01239 [Candidatus Methanoperedenaceae archaeon GB50]